MKKIILLALFSVSTIALSQEIYTLKTSDGSTLLTAKEPTEEKYGNLQLRKNILSRMVSIRLELCLLKDKFDGKRAAH
jgi:hypothetical protein